MNKIKKVKEIQKRIDIASGKEKADLVLKNAKVLNVFTNEWLTQDVAISDSYIAGVGTYDGKKEIDLKGKYIVPGFIDTHLHMESTMVTPGQLVHEVLPYGTTTLIADPHEIANVSGLEGIKYLMNEAKDLPCNIYFMLPSCVPATDFEDNGAILTADELNILKDSKNVLGLGEVMDCVSVIHSKDSMLQKINLFSDKIIDGHAPSLKGKELQAYRTAGILTDHECSDFNEVLEKIRTGMAVLIREGSAAKNLEPILKGVIENNLSYHQFAFCTDDKHIEDIRQEGHISAHIKKSIAMGVPCHEAYKMASYYGANIYRLNHLGAVAASYQADLVVLNDIENVIIHSVYHKGKEIHDYSLNTNQNSNETLLNSVHIKSFQKSDLIMKYNGEETSVIELVPNQITTKRITVKLPCSNSVFVPNEEYQKLAVLERHHKTGKIGLCCVKGFQIHGAIGSTVAHDSHNLIVIGDNDDDMALAIETLKEQGGGYILVQDNKVVGNLPLPICGLITNENIETVQATLSQMKQTARKMGIQECFDPFITMSFLSLPVIPEIRITNRGLFDSVKMEFI